MRRYGRIQGLVLSLGWPDFYRDVAKNWRGIGLLYVMLVIMLTWIVLLAKMQLSFSHVVRDELPKHLDQVPEFSIKKGKVSSPAPQPLVINDERGDPLFILDTTGQTDFDKTKAKFLLTETKFFQRDQNQVQIHDLTNFPWDVDVSKENFVSWATTAANWSGVVFFPFCVVWSMIGWLIMMLLAGAVSSAANGRARLPFGAVMRLAGVGGTLAQYLLTAVMFFQLNVTWFITYPICLAISIGYAIFGIRCAESGQEFDDDYDDERHERRERRERGEERDLPPPGPGGADDGFRARPGP